MPRLVISIDGAIIKEVELTKERTTLGRRPYNDIVISNLAVSGEHALLHCDNGRVSVEDLQSTNGTFVNRQRVTHQDLHHGDVLQVGQYQLRVELTPEEYEAWGAAASAAQPACLRLEGQMTREVALVKPVTTLGKPGVAVASITRSATGFTLARVEGPEGSLRLNGQGVGTEAQVLRHEDRIEVAGSRLQFLLLPV
ncbi:FHA domain-containing protein [Comamonas endophytica]|uniref:FHA domain-containing protein n=1 Tax=Comamonas endophytica TaxID=2949090 RepID=A0ABY6G5F1_9BURK|nr:MULTISPECIES: FHA domain-containing protein [unclassified Acidovorax]MCD2512307.1 FHA domain-containing protein [Acidovorax sp. D4N7]UYG50236.1 FHA domain-containing protein [Acidovorax sp. 5MLIR]